MKKDTDHGVGSTDHLISIRTAVTGTCSAPPTTPWQPVTAIEAVETEKAEDGAWYTIQGVRVDKPAKGLYIHNGRKVVVK